MCTAGVAAAAAAVALASFAPLLLFRSVGHSVGRPGRTVSEAAAAPAAAAPFVRPRSPLHIFSCPPPIQAPLTPARSIHPNTNTQTNPSLGTTAATPVPTVKTPLLPTTRDPTMAAAATDSAAAGGGNRLLKYVWR